MDFVLGQWIDGNSIKLENMRKRMGLGRKNDLSFGHTVFEVSIEYWMVMDFSLKEKIGMSDLGLEVISILEMLKSCGQMKSLMEILQSDNTGPRREL